MQELKNRIGFSRCEGVETLDGMGFIPIAFCGRLVVVVVDDVDIDVGFKSLYLSIYLSN